jgi:hypothetical protein
VKDFTHTPVLAYVLMKIKDFAAVPCQIAKNQGHFGHNFGKTSG